jgi:hypothetical protein
VRSPSLFLAFCCALGGGGGAGCAGCGGAVVDLGEPKPPPYRFGTPRLLAELDTTYGNENPTLTADLLALFFTSNRGAGNGDVWTARRASPRGAFDPPVLVAEVSSPDHEASPAIALDGLSLYFGSDREAVVAEDLDIWSASRPDRTAPWAAAQKLTALNSSAKDIPRPPGQRGLVMPMASERDSLGGYKTYLSARPSVDQPFGPPAPISGLTGSDATFADAFLSDDGLTLFYASAASPTGAPDLFVAWRLTTADAFSLPTPLGDLNSAGDERDPWLSPDGTLFYFTSDRDGSLQIYEAPATRQPR